MDIKYAKLEMKVFLLNSSKTGKIIKFHLSENNRFYVDIEFEDGTIEYKPLACVGKL